MLSSLQQWFGSIGLGFFDYLSGISYGLLALSYLMRNIKWLRLITLFACALDLVIYYQIRPGQPMWVQLFFTTVFIVINSFQLYILWCDGRRTIFEGDAGFLFKKVFQLLTPGEFKRLLKLSRFQNIESNVHLMREGTEVEQISVLVHGQLAILLGDNVLNNLHAGAFVGEMGYLTGRAASVNVISTTPARILCIDRKNLDVLEARHPEIHAKLIGIMGRDIADKLRQLNAVTNEKYKLLSGFGGSAFTPLA